jgi:hypothetical protein
MTTRVESDDTVEISVNGRTLAHFVDSGNGMDGEILETADLKMSASDLIAVAMFILAKAGERAGDEEDRP